MAPVASLTRQMFTGEWALARARAPRTQNPDLQRDLLIKASDWLALLPRWPSGECLFAAAATHLAKKQSGAFRVCFFFSLTTLRNSLDEYTRPERNGILDRSHCRRGRTKFFFFFFPGPVPFSSQMKLEKFPSGSVSSASTCHGFSQPNSFYTDAHSSSFWFRRHRRNSISFVCF